MRLTHRRRTFFLGIAALLTVLALVVPLVAQSGAAGTLVFIGTYASPASKGIYVSRLDPSTGALSPPTLAAEIRNPSFVAASPDGRFLYAVSEVDAVAGTPGGAVAGYAIDKAAGTLKLAQHAVDGRRRPVPTSASPAAWCSRRTTVAAASPPIRRRRTAR